MPRSSRRRIRLNKSNKMRWSMKKIAIDDHSSDEDVKMDSNEMIVDDNLKDIGHDESTFRSGEVTSRRWISNETAPLFSKGRGRSLMLSDFMVCHPSGPFFYSNEDEWQKAITKFPDLLKNNDINYIDRTSTAAINVGADAYFDNETVLLQFQRLLKMLKFKTDYKDHDIDVLLDNARKHTACQYNLNDFRKNIDSRCPVDVIEDYDENDIKKTIQRFFSSDPHENKSKGLLE
ncbi:unnamed protein product [Rotaria sp. Silwood2]|nr:unnamed protein product [Rotaria sp. Silwood2]